tara:strand:- start:2091 stop:2507 length:417 start_codon:yes stop_codon:yes gene_type:complete
MNNLKEKLNNYPYMDYPTFKFIKEEILKLSDRNIMDLHDHMDIITENEGEFSADIDTEEDWRDYQRRVKYINKLKKVTWKAVERELDRYDAIPIETHIKEADTDCLLAMNEYEVNGTTMTQKVKDLVINELAARGEIK